MAIYFEDNKAAKKFLKANGYENVKWKNIFFWNVDLEDEMIYVRRNVNEKTNALDIVRDASGEVAYWMDQRPITDYSPMHLMEVDKDSSDEDEVAIYFASIAMMEQAEKFLIGDEITDEEYPLPDFTTDNVITHQQLMTELNEKHGEAVTVSVLEEGESLIIGVLANALVGGGFMVRSEEGLDAGHHLIHDGGYAPDLALGDEVICVRLVGGEVVIFAKAADCEVIVHLEGELNMPVRTTNLHVYKPKNRIVSLADMDADFFAAFGYKEDDILLDATVAPTALNIDAAIAEGNESAVVLNDIMAQLVEIRGLVEGLWDIQQQPIVNNVYEAVSATATKAELARLQKGQKK